MAATWALAFRSTRQGSGAGPGRIVYVPTMTPVDLQVGAADVDDAWAGHAAVQQPQLVAEFAARGDFNLDLSQIETGRVRIGEVGVPD